MSVCRLARFCFALLTLLYVGCSGGGDSGTPEQKNSEQQQEEPSSLLASFSETELLYRSYTEKLFTGSRETGVLSNEDFVYKSALLLGKNSLLSRTPELREVFYRTQNILPQNYYEVEYVELPDFSTTVPCREGGAITGKGLPGHTFGGVIQITFEECTIENFTYNGNGAFSPAINNVQNRALFLNEVKVLYQSQTMTITGIVNTDYNSKLGVTQDTVINYDYIETPVLFENFSYTNHTTDPYHDSFDRFLEAHGKICLQNSGCIEVETTDKLKTRVSLKDLSEKPERGTFLLEAGESKGIIQFTGHNQAIIGLAEDMESDYTKGFGFHNMDQFTPAAVADIKLIAYNDINLEPVIFNVQLIPNRIGDHIVPTFIIHSSDYYDYEDDPVNIIAQETRLNSSLVSDKNSLFLLDNVISGDELITQFQISDQKNVVTFNMDYSEEALLKRNVIEGLPTHIRANEEITFTATYGNPNVQSSLLPAILLESPEGMTIDENGIVRWRAGDPKHISAQAVTIGNPDSDRGVFSTQITIIPDHTSVKRFSTSQGKPLLHGTFFNSDEQRVVFVRDMIITLVEFVSTSEIVTTSYPFQLPFSSEISYVIPIECNSNNAGSELMVSSAQGIVTICDFDKPPKLIKQYAGNDSLAVAYGDIDNDGKKEVISIIKSSVLEVLDLNGNIKYSGTYNLSNVENPLYSGNLSVDYYFDATIAIANIDDDPQKEIVTSSGIIIDGLTKSIQKTSSRFIDRFGHTAVQIAAHDIDNDNKDEIFVRFENDNDLLIYNLDKDELLTRISLGSAGTFKSFDFFDTDGDGNSEIIGYSSYNGSAIDVYKITGTTPALQFSANNELFDNHGWLPLNITLTDGIEIVSTEGIFDLHTLESVIIDKRADRKYTNTYNFDSGINIFSPTVNGIFSDFENILKVDSNGKGNYYKLPQDLQSHWGIFGGFENELSKWVAMPATGENGLLAYKLWDSTLSDSTAKVLVEPISNPEFSYVDINNDGAPEMAYVINGNVYFHDTSTDTAYTDLELTHKSISRGIKQLNLDSNHVLIAAASYGQISIWSYADGVFKKVLSSSLICDQWELGLFTESGKPEIACVTTDSTYTESEITFYSFEESDLLKENSVTIAESPGFIQKDTITPASNNTLYMVVLKKHTDMNSSSKFLSRYYQLESHDFSKSLSKIWVSPPISNEVNSISGDISNALILKVSSTESKETIELGFWDYVYLFERPLN